MSNAFVSLIADSAVQAALDPDGRLVIYPTGDVAQSLVVPAELIRDTLAKVTAAVSGTPERFVSDWLDGRAEVRALRPQTPTDAMIVERLQRLGRVHIVDWRQAGTFNAHVENVFLNDGLARRDVAGAGKTEVAAARDLYDKLTAASLVTVYPGPQGGVGRRLRWDDTAKDWRTA